MKNSNGEAEEKIGRGGMILLVLAAAAVAALIIGYVRSGIISGLVEGLPGLQEELEECGELASEYLALRKQQVDPKDRDRYVRTLMEKLAREHGVRGALRGISETEV
ncbi:unnamed protein product, partial [marine sediment metagenome]